MISGYRIARGGLCGVGLLLVEGRRGGASEGWSRLSMLWVSV